MFKSTKFLVGVTLVAGLLLGYATASTKWWMPWPAEAAANLPAAANKPADPTPAPGGGCCGLDQSKVEALVAAHNKEVAARAQDSGKKPNILFIMGDDIGWFNIGAYHQGIMSGKTPNLDRLASHGMLFTDYYAEASCTAGRANFIIGELPIRTGMTTVGQAGADVGLPA